MLKLESFCPHLFKNPALVSFRVRCYTQGFGGFCVLFFLALSFSLSLKVWSPSLSRTFTPLTENLLDELSGSVSAAVGRQLKQKTPDLNKDLKRCSWLIPHIQT